MILNVSTLWLLLVSSRPRQWIKNVLIFAAIIFNGQLFNVPLFVKSLWGFIVFCLLSSAVYLINDLFDAPYDRLHPQKRNRPIASGKLSTSLVIQTIFIISLTGFVISIFLGYNVFFLGLLFAIVNIAYSLGLKRLAVVDVLLIATSFIIRAFAGEIVTGYHLPIWLMLTVIFLALFLASGKRRSELILEGAKTRPALLRYRTQLLDLYTSTFANASLISYALFTFFTDPPKFREHLTKFLLLNFPEALGRKWLMAVTIPFVIFGIMRYAQLIYERQAGERPEKLITGDIPLLLTVVGWGLTVILVIYIA